MKKILSLLTLALLGAATPVFADFNFEILWQKYDNKAYEGYTGSYYTIKVTGNPGETGKIYLADKFNNIYSGAQSEALNGVIGTVDDPYRVKITDFGYTYARQGMTDVVKKSMSSENIVPLDLDANLNPSQNTYSFWNDAGTEKVSRTRNGYYLGEFKAGDEIQVYMKAVLVDVDDNVIPNTIMETTSNNPDGEYNSRYNIAGADPLNNGMQLAALYLKNELPFGIMGDPGTGNYVYGSSTEVDWVPQGSPLPGGVQIALIAGLFGLGFWYVRRRKAVTA